MWVTTNRRNPLIIKSGKRDSNPRPSAWEADALPTELLPQTYFRTERPPKTSRTECWRRPEFPKRERKNTKSNVGGDGFEPPKAYASRFTVCPIWPLWYPPENSIFQNNVHPRRGAFRTTKIRIGFEFANFFVLYSLFFNPLAVLWRFSG